MSRTVVLRILTLLILAGFGLRAWNLDSIAVEHFDEGVYASNYFISTINPNEKYPFQELYAPSLFPTILSEVLLYTGGNPHSVMWVNVLLGTLIIPAVYWTTREIVGDWQDESLRDLAGLSAASLITFHGMFIAYSRAALTDTPVILWMTLAVGLGTRGLRTRQLQAVIGAGLLTALAWWTKYNGWLPIAILGAGAVAWILSNRPNRSTVIGAVVTVCAIAMIAFTCWLPYLASIQKTGGYAAVAKNHAQYIVGLSGWLDSVARHFWVERAYNRFLGFYSVTAIVFLGIAHASTVLRKAPLSLLPAMLAIYVLPFFTGSLTWLAMISVVALILWTTKNRESKISHPSMGFWILAAWLGGLALTTPLYSPYPRLLLPLLTGFCIACGISVPLIIQQWCVPLSDADLEKKKTFESAGGSRRLLTQFAFSSSLLLGGLITMIFIQVPFEPRNSLPVIAEETLKEIESYISEDAPPVARRRPNVIYVLGEPGLFYHLASQASHNSETVVIPTATTEVLNDAAASAQANIFLITATKSPSEFPKLPNARAIDLQKFYHPSRLVDWDERSANNPKATPPRAIQIWTPIQ